jgi:hypothetical protein
MCAVWNWEIHQIRETVRELILDEIGINQWMLQQAFHTFPGMRSLVHRTKMIPYKVIDSPEILDSTEKIAEIQLYRAAHLMPIGFLKKVRRLELIIMDALGITLLTEAIPQIGMLENIQIKIDDLAISGVGKKKFEELFHQCLEAISRKASIKEVIIDDESLAPELRNLEPRITHIRFKSHGIQSISHSNFAPIERKTRMTASFPIDKDRNSKRSK